MGREAESMKTLATMALVALLAACGGGDPEEEQATASPPDCKAKPELCR
jgi:hypothetical protein